MVGAAGQPMKILVSGSNGLLGSTFKREFSKDSNLNVSALDRSKLDITNYQELMKAFDFYRPDVFINCAAFTDVDGAETNQLMAKEINTTALKFIGEIADRFKSHVIHFSTDYVFDGETDTLYTEESTPNPINFYGKSKWQGEKKLEEVLGSQAIIIRTAWLYGKNRKSFIDQIVEKILDGSDQIRVVQDQIGQLTHTQLVVDAVKAMLDIGIKGHGGVWNLTSQGQSSWIGIANIANEYLNGKSEIFGITSESLNRMAKRPKFSALNASKFESQFYSLPSWEEDLIRYLSTRMEEKGCHAL
jgi:dTDP-4-dehydrorhamnose reductase